MTRVPGSNRSQQRGASLRYDYWWKQHRCVWLLDVAYLG
jgi:hypothetical protein